MCTPCTLTRLVRWRVKDWALNFLTCGFPLEEEPETFSSPSHQVSTVNMVFDSIGETKNSASRRQKSRRTIRCSTQAPDTNGSRKKSSTDDQSNWPHFADEDYIVFCFGEDGAFDVVKDAKSEASNDHIDCTITKSPRPVNRKLNYGDEHAETYPKQRHEFVLHEDGDDINPRNQRDFITYDKEVEEIIDSRSPSCRVHRGDQIEENEERGTVSVESNGSNQSDNSTGSFAFPILGWEWTGSPVQMPKSEGQHLRKHKARFVPFHCFRFFDKN